MMKTSTRPAGKYLFALVPPARITPNSCLPRRLFNENDIVTLADSIRRYGILQPLTVRPSRQQISAYELISGERRLCAARLAGLREVPIIIMKGISDRAACEIAISENEKRADMNMFERAEATAAYLACSGLTLRQAADSLSIAPSELSKDMLLLKLSFDERRFITENNIPRETAVASIKIGDGRDRLSVLKYITEKNMSYPDSAEFCIRFAADPSSYPYIGSRGRNRATVEFYLSEDQPAQRAKCSVKDAGFFINSIDNTLRRIQSCGVEISAIKSDSGDYVEYNIQLPKNTPGF